MKPKVPTKEKRIPVGYSLSPESHKRLEELIASWAGMSRGEILDYLIMNAPDRVTITVQPASPA